MLNLAFPRAVTRVADGAALLEHMPTLTGTCRALVEAGMQVLVLQRFEQDIDITRDDARYCLRRDAQTAASARPWTYPGKLLALARAWAPDVVHLNGLIFPTQVMQARAALGRQARILVQHHGELPLSRKLRALQRICLRFADGFIFNGAGNADAWRVAGIIRATQPVYEAVEGSCDFAPMPMAEAHRITGAHGSPMVLWVGRLHPRKDPLTALDGFAAAVPYLPNAHFYMIYTDETLLPQIEARVSATPHLADRVHLIGKVDHATLPAWYSAADVFLTSSPAEGSNYALIESMSCSALPVCSDIPPHRFITGGLGAQWPVGDAVACADALVRAFGQASIERRLAIRHHFDTHLAWASIAQQLLRAYVQVIKDVQV